MRQYLDYLQDILENGTQHEDRTGTGTKRVFGRQLRFDLTEGFPLVTTKRMWMRGVAEELFWFLRGETNIWPLLHKGVGIWTDNAYEAYREKTEKIAHMSERHPVSKERFKEAVRECKDPNTLDHDYTNFAGRWGDLGPIYGKQWRNFEGSRNQVDQIEKLIRGLKENPGSRRHLVTAWNPAEIEEMSLPPCHYAFQVFTRELSFGEREKLYYKNREDRFSIVALPHKLDEQKPQVEKNRRSWTIAVFLAAPSASSGISGRSMFSLGCPGISPPTGCLRT